MKRQLPALAGLGLGLLLGLLWKPYSVEIQRLGPASALVRVNRITGSAKILQPGNTYWTPVADAAPVPDWVPQEAR